MHECDDWHDGECSRCCRLWGPQVEEGSEIKITAPNGRDFTYAPASVLRMLREHEKTGVMRVHMFVLPERTKAGTSFVWVGTIDRETGIPYQISGISKSGVYPMVEATWDYRRNAFAVRGVGVSAVTALKHMLMTLFGVTHEEIEVITF